MLATATPAVAAQPPDRPRIVVRFKHDVGWAERIAAMRDAGVRRIPTRVGATDVAEPKRGVSPQRAVRRLRGDRRVAWTELALAARASYIPNDSGVAAVGGPPYGWTVAQWELGGPFGINAPAAWSQASRLGGSGGHGVTIAVLDSGVAYAGRETYRRSPDLAASRLVRGYDFVSGDPYPNDKFGHGTFVAHAVGATANNLYGSAGVAYRAAIMPVRVLNSKGEGDFVTVARGLRFALENGADIVNVSVELFDMLPPNSPRSLTSSRFMRSELHRARLAGVPVVSATGNSFDLNVPSKGYDDLLISVGGSTEHGCLGSYSNHGPGTDLVAPGGGADAALPQDPNCAPAAPPGRDIYGISFRAATPGMFEILPRAGTSAAAPFVTGVVALVLASDLLGEDPAPAAVERHLEITARDLGLPGRDRHYGAGLLDAAAATTRPSG